MRVCVCEGVCVYANLYARECMSVIVSALGGICMCVGVWEWECGCSYGCVRVCERVCVCE